MSLTSYLIEGLLPEEEKKQTTAVYAGGFKPPTSGHFEVVQQALKENPEIDEFIIFVGAKERNGISQTESLLIWEIYNNYLPFKVKIVPTSVPPIKAVYDFAKNHPTREVLWVIGAREGNEEDFKDITSRTKSISKYPNLELRTIVTSGGVSGTAARNAAKVSLDKFAKFVPDQLSDEETEEVYNIVADKVQEVLTENASYGQHIDVVEKIAQLTNHMIDKGMNIEPLPTMEFVDGDSENAKDFFGKTAYYDPNRQHIVLYTEGRHPKDIVRSYAHEMIHHIQYLEDRLGDVAGTDTTSDEHLTKLEKEANLRGTMTFRNWTDSILNEAIVGEKIECDKCNWSWNIVDGGDDLFICHKCGHDNTPINEKKNKDPFGINAYAMELGRLREDETEYKIYVDMDGVVADFDQRFIDLSGMLPREFEAKYGKNAFWEFIDEGDNKLKFWVGIPQMSDAQQLIDFVSKYDYEMLTAPSLKKQSLMGKGLWMINQTKKGLFPSKPKVNYKSAKNKKDFAAPNHILIDDKASTIDSWNAAGGIGILHTSASNTISQLKKLGL